MSSHDENKNTLDFDNESGIVRGVYRIPVDPEDQVSVTINGKAYPVINIVDRGLQIACETAGEFEEGKDLGRIELTVQGRPVTVKAHVVYTTKVDLDVFACGISIEFQDSENEKRVRSFVDEKRKTLFGSESS